MTRSRHGPRLQNTQQMQALNPKKPQVQEYYEEEDDEHVVYKNGRRSNRKTLAAKMALKAGVSSAVLDIGRITPTAGGRAFATLKGLVDGGLDVPHSENLYPNESRINGEHVSDKMVKEIEKVTKKIEGIKK